MRETVAAATEMATGWGLKSFTRDALDELHAATLDVLRSTGVSVDCDEALDILDKGGCWTNNKTRVARFPDHVVNQAVSLCPMLKTHQPKPLPEDLVAELGRIVKSVEK